MAIDNSGKWWVGTEISDIQAFLDAFTRSNGGYPSTTYRMIRCPCGMDWFKLDRAGDVTRRTCDSCGLSNFICRRLVDWEEAENEEGAEHYSCVECDSKVANLVIGFAAYENNPEFDGIK